MSIDSKNIGVSLKREHMSSYLQEAPPWGWFEVIAENLLSYTEGELVALENLRQDYHLSLHMTCGDIGGVEPLAENHLARVKSLMERFEPNLISDHLSFCRAEQVYFHDLLPIPYTNSYLQHTLHRVHKVQDILGRRILLENISQYTRYTEDSLAEAEFLLELAKQSDCGLLLDVNNLYVNEKNLNWSAEDYINGLHATSVHEIHIAGHQQRGSLLIDTHDGPASLEVLKLLKQFQMKSTASASTPVILEWDQNLPCADKLALTVHSLLKDLQDIADRTEVKEDELR
ncbi:MAG: DUF692 domain-containing protein [Oligoflexus sp.]